MTKRREKGTINMVLSKGVFIVACTLGFGPRLHACLTKRGTLHLHEKGALATICGRQAMKAQMLELGVANVDTHQRDGLRGHDINSVCPYCFGAVIKSYLFGTSEDAPL